MKKRLKGIIFDDQYIAPFVPIVHFFILDIVCDYFACAKSKKIFINVFKSYKVEINMNYIAYF
jgi:hypothetical protein